MRILVSVFALYNIFLICLAQLNSTYVVIVPQTLRPGRPLHVSINIIKASGPVSVTASLSLSSGTMVSSKFGSFLQGNAGELQVQTFSNFSDSSYNLTVVGSGGLTFFNWTTISVFSKSMSIYVQTDKALYKPGDLVQFRVFAVFQDLKTYLGPMDIQIKDPQGNKIKQWLSLTDPQGVHTLNLSLTSMTLQGVWQIISNTYAETNTKTFTVEEYVLPKFEVKVNLPSFLYSGSINLPVTVSAKYTYGQPVKGLIVITAAVITYSSENGGSSIQHSGQLQNGTFFLTLTTKELARLAPPCPYNCEIDTLQTKLQRLTSTTIVVNASVTESLTNVVLQGNNTVVVFNNKFKLTWMSSTPTVFKDGLTFVGYVQVTLADGSPLSAGDLQPPNNVVSVQYSWSGASTDTSKPGQVVHTNSVLSENGTYVIPSSGIVEVVKAVPVGYTSLTMQVNYRDLSAYQYNIQKFISRDDESVQVSIANQSGSLQIGLVNFKIQSTGTPSTYYFVILSKGELIYHLVLPATKPLTNYVLNLTEDLAQSASPKAKVMVWYITTKGEIIVDMLEVSVDALFANNVSLAFSTAQVEPGDNVTLKITAYQNSYVGLLVVDQSVKLLKDDNDITQAMVRDDMTSYDNTNANNGGGPIFIDGPRGIGRKKRSFFFPWPIFSGGKDANEIFQNAGLNILTDVYIYQQENIYYPYMEFGRPVMMDKGIPAMSGAVDNAANSGLAEPQSFRQDFPEAWIFLDVFISSNGETVINATVPDTITSWIASGFAVSSVKGLGIADPGAQITVFKPFFISLNLPYSVIRGEQVVLQILVFNYLNSDQQVKLTIKQSTAFKVRGLNDVETSAKFQELVEYLMVPSNDGTSFKVWIIPQTLGYMPINVKAQTSVAADELIQNLLVEAEGEPHQESSSVFINLQSGGSLYLQTFPVQYPTTGLVQGTKSVVVTAMGNPLSNMLSNLNNLIQMPYGCGEQTILTLSPNVYALWYIETTDQNAPGIPALRSQALNNIHAGYQRELTFQRTDNSFSAFGNSDVAGSTWLTAFVIRAFNHARQFLGNDLDQTILDKAMNFIINQQNTSGAFVEPPGGRVIHTDMQGGSSNGLPLTAYTLISLMENHRDRPTKNDMLMSNLVSTINRAVVLLVSQLDTVKTDPYTLALITYALTLNENSNADKALQYLNKLATEKGGVKYWSDTVQPTCAQTQYWCPTPSYNIEMTAYGLLIYVLRKDVTGALPMAKYLISKSSSSGGYGSTQNTVLALQALTLFTILSGSSDQERLTVSLTADSFQYNFSTITKDNTLLLQSVQLPNPDVSGVQITAAGLGVAVVQVTVYYHLTVTSNSSGIGVTVNSTQLNNNTIEINMCAIWLENSFDSGMVLIEVQQLTGYTADVNNVMSNNPGRGLKKVEVTDNSLNLYLDQVTGEGTCIVTRSISTAQVAYLQPRTVKASSYYKPEINDVKFYPRTSTDQGQHAAKSIKVNKAAKLTSIFYWSIIGVHTCLLINAAH